MGGNFIFCHKCGTRNFENDKICGVCKTDLIVQTPNVQNRTNISKYRKNNYYIIVIIISGLIFLYYNVFEKDKPAETIVNYDKVPYSPSDTFTTKESISTNNEDKEILPEIQLSVINDKTTSPRKITISTFSGLLKSLQKRYSNRTEKDLANALIATYNIIIRSGRNDSLLEFTTAFDSYSKEVDSKYNFSIEEALAVFAKISYEI
jgi:hypothetical protein